MKTDQLPEKAYEKLRKIRRKYQVDFEPLKLRDIEVQILQVTDLESILAGKDPFKDVQNFPFWIRLWEASMLLADLIASTAPPENNSLLELGAGLGAPGLAAAASGYDVTLSDYEPHILDFQRVSAAASGLNDINFQILDWKKIPKMEMFNTIIGAEILFRDEFFEPLLNLFNQLLCPGGVIYLAHDIRRKSLPKFLLKAEKDYEIAVSTRKMKSEDEEITIIINRLIKRN
jgi:protein N-lysine methyltransferase METTL21A